MKYNCRQNIITGSLHCLFSINAVVQPFCTCVVVLWPPKDKIFLYLLKFRLTCGPPAFPKPFWMFIISWFYHKHFILAIFFKKLKNCFALLTSPFPGDLSNPRIKPRSPALQVNSLPSEPLGREWLPNSRILVWRFPSTEEPGGIQSMGRKESDTTDRLTLSLTSPGYCHN